MAGRPRAAPLASDARCFLTCCPSPHHDAPQGSRRQAPAHRPGLRLLQAAEAKGGLPIFTSSCLLRLPPAVWMSKGTRCAVRVEPREPNFCPQLVDLSVAGPGPEAYNSCTPVSARCLTRSPPNPLFLSLYLALPFGMQPRPSCLVLGGNACSSQADRPSRRRRVHPAATKYKAVEAMGVPTG
jgi:hypothetical protein